MMQRAGVRVFCYYEIKSLIANHDFPSQFDPAPSSVPSACRNVRGRFFGSTTISRRRAARHLHLHNQQSRLAEIHQQG
jgi:hypothetical protein